MTDLRELQKRVEEMLQTANSVVDTMTKDLSEVTDIRDQLQQLEYDFGFVIKEQTNAGPTETN